MKENDYPAQTAEMIERAFDDLRDGTAAEIASGRLLAAQAIATLGAARETRIQSLLMVATAAPADGRSLNPELTEAAYGAALTMLGLVDEEPPMDLTAERLEYLRSVGLDNDPADADLGDLGGRA